VTLLKRTISRGSEKSCLLFSRKIELEAFGKYLYQKKKKRRRVCRAGRKEERKEEEDLIMKGVSRRRREESTHTLLHCYILLGSLWHQALRSILFCLLF